MKIITKAVKARNGMVIKPNQLIYCPVQGILPQATALSVKNETFCIK